MPTGYTSVLKDDTTLEAFALRCARAFGAMILMRDDPMDAPIPDEFAPSEYHAKGTASAKARLAELQAMTVADVEAAQIEEAAKEVKYRAKHIAESRAQRATYERMLAMVSDWTPPTKDHEEMKTFMRQQLTESIKFDCNESYYAEEKPRLTGKAWLADATAKAQHDIEYHEAEHLKEVDRAMKRTMWVRLLRESLKAK